jgi:PhnB protein
MAVKAIIKMASLHVYLNFDGTCEDAFNFYKSVFGGEFTAFNRFSEMPPEMPVPEGDKNKVMHVSLPIGEHSILMGSDTIEGFGPLLKEGNNFSLSFDAESEAHADKMFNALSEDGNVVMPMDKSFWGSYFGMLTDKFGINWMISFSDENQEQG